MTTSFDHSDCSYELVIPEDKGQEPAWALAIAGQIKVQPDFRLCPGNRGVGVTLKCKNCEMVKSIPSSADALKHAVLETFQDHIMLSCKAVPCGIQLLILAGKGRRSPTAFWDHAWSRLCAQQQLAEEAFANRSGKKERTSHESAIFSTLPWMKHQSTVVVALCISQLRWVSRVQQSHQLALWLSRIYQE
jgi:hypothetical protein